MSPLSNSMYKFQLTPGICTPNCQINPLNRYSWVSPRFPKVASQCTGDFCGFGPIRCPTQKSQPMGACSHADYYAEILTLGDQSKSGFGFKRAPTPPILRGGGCFSWCWEGESLAAAAAPSVLRSARSQMRRRAVVPPVLAAAALLLLLLLAVLLSTWQG